MRLEQLGAGLKVIEDPSHAAAARRLRAAIESAPGVAGAADELERTAAE
jgi:hypothetical protein